MLEERTHKVCESCKDIVPLEEFRHLNRREKKEKQHWCNSCYRLWKKEHILKRKKDELLAAISQTTVLGKRMRPEDIPTLSDVMAGMMKRFGGFDQFLDVWYLQLQKNLIVHPGGKTGLDQLHALAKITGEVQKLEHERRRVDKLTEEEIAEELDAYIKRMHASPPKVITQEVKEDKPEDGAGA